MLSGCLALPYRTKFTDTKTVLKSDIFQHGRTVLPGRGKKKFAALNFDFSRA
jgi:hypothetical protein